MTFHRTFPHDRRGRRRRRRRRHSAPPSRWRSPPAVRMAARHGMGGADEMIGHLIAHAKAKLNLNTSQQGMFDTAVADSKAAREAGRALHQKVRDTLQAELAKPEPDLAAVAAAADAASDQGRAQRKAIRADGSRSTRTFTPEQKAVVKDMLQKRLARCRIVPREDARAHARACSTASRRLTRSSPARAAAAIGPGLAPGSFCVCRARRGLARTPRAQPESRSRATPVGAHSDRLFRGAPERGGDDRLRQQRRRPRRALRPAPRSLVSPDTIIAGVPAPSARAQLARSRRSPMRRRRGAGRRRSDPRVRRRRRRRSAASAASHPRRRRPRIPRREQRAHRRDDGGIVVDDDDAAAGERAARSRSPACRVRARDAPARRRRARARHGDREARARGPASRRARAGGRAAPRAGARSQGRAPCRARRHDCAAPRPAARTRRRCASRIVRARCRRPVSITSMRTRPARRRAPSDDAAGRRVAQRVGERGCAGSRSSSTGSVATASASARRAARVPRAAACGAKSAASRANSGCSGDGGRARPQRAGVEPRQVEQLREECFERLDRRVDARDQRRHVRVARLGRERGGEEAHRVQRLAQVVARGGEELALGAVRGLGGGARGERRLASAP